MPNSATLIFQLYSGREALPVEGAVVTVTSPDTGRVMTLISNSSGRTPPIRVYAPPKEESLEPNFQGLPYSLYNARVQAQGYTPSVIRGIQMFDDEESVVSLEMNPQPIGRDRIEQDEYDIPENGLLLTNDRQPEGPSQDTPSGRVLTEVYIPRYITVHLGAPSASAQNVTVDFAY